MRFSARRRWRLRTEAALRLSSRAMRVHLARSMAVMLEKGKAVSSVSSEGRAWAGCWREGPCRVGSRVRLLRADGLDEPQSHLQREARGRHELVGVATKAQHESASLVQGDEARCASRLARNEPRPWWLVVAAS